MGGEDLAPLFLGEKGTFQGAWDSYVLTRREGGLSVEGFRLGEWLQADRRWIDDERDNTFDPFPSAI